MTGLFLSHHALLQVSFAVSVSGIATFLDIEFVIDTGFAGFLTLPLSAVQALNLPLRRSLIANLADNSAVELEVYSAEILWQNHLQTVDVIATGVTPLLGTLLLDGCELNVRFSDNEAVMVNPL